ncbi:MAG: hypothetical protein FWH17_07560 [Oscillospiraceae bacterium]|nr:hypothetical protein [Oscillospiraceae bacterium]
MGGRVTAGGTSSCYIGGFVGTNSGGRIIGSSVTGGLLVSGKNYTGGFVGVNSAGRILRSFATAEVKGTSYVGGFAGYSSNDRIEQCYATGNVEGTSEVGGFVGYVTSTSLMKDCYSTGNVLGSGNNVAGFVGRILSNSERVENCYTISTHINGLRSNGGTVVSSYFNKDLVPLTNGSAEGRSTAQMSDITTYAGWDFDDVWEMGEGGYPVLRGMELPDKDGVEYIEVSTAEGLAAIQSNIMGKYRLTADIDLSGVAWTPIGTNSRPFNGILDGNGHTISNLTVNLPEQDYVGMFGNTNGLVKNLTLENVQVTGRSYVGGLAGQNSGVISDVSVMGGTVTAGGTSSCYIGGFVGRNSGGRIIGSSVTGGLLVSGKNYTGGFVGVNSTGRILRSFATAEVKGTSCTGGFVGYSITDRIEQCYATGNVEGTSEVGGFVGGIVSTSLVKDCYSTGNVLGSSISNNSINNTAGFLGWASATSGRVENCYTTSTHTKGFRGTGGTVVSSYFNKDLVPLTNGSAEGRSTAQMSDITTYVGWDFEDVWEMGEAGYPVLRGMELPDKDGVESEGIDDVNITVLIILPDSEIENDILVGETITATAILSDGWLFMHWQDENGNIISTDMEYSFIATVDIILIAIFEPLDS